MVKRLLMKIRVIQTEWHWYCITRCRKKAKTLFEKGAAFTSDEILRVSKRLDYHCNSIWRLEYKYKSPSKVNRVYNNEYREKALCEQSQYIF